jgi:hypothetical protein
MSFPNGRVTCPLITVSPVLGFVIITENDLILRDMFEDDVNPYAGYVNGKIWCKYIVS